MRRAWWYVMSAVGAALFWWAVATISFSVTGFGPLEALRGAGGRTSAVVLALVLGGLGAYALLARATSRRTGTDRG